jgi:phosphoglycerate-specific signal transduction histidine kinase
MAVLPAIVLSVLATAQRREFLTDGEIEAIREAQDPNERLKLYTQYAQQRLELVEKALAGSEADRAQQIHAALSEYNRILESIDANVDQALTRRDLMRKGLEYAFKNEPDFLKLLQSFQARNPKDLDEYRFALSQAIENTKDGIDGLRAALQKQPKGRQQEKEAREAKRKKG